jgi:hypothetical protein
MVMREALDFGFDMPDNELTTSQTYLYSTTTIAMSTIERSV